MVSEYTEQHNIRDYFFNGAKETH